MEQNNEDIKEHKWKYLFPLLGCVEYAQIGEKKDREKGAGSIEIFTKRMILDGYTYSSLFIMSVYTLSAIVYHSLNPLEITRKFKEENKIKQAEVEERKSLIDKLYVDPGYIDKNHDKFISIEEELEFRKIVGLDTGVDTIKTEKGNTIYKERYNEFYFMQQIDQNKLKHALKVYGERK